MFWEPYIKTDSLKGIGISIGIFLLFLILRRLFSKYAAKLVINFSRRVSRKFLTRLLIAFEKPVEWLCVIIGTYIAVGYFPYLAQSNEFFGHLIQASIIILVGWGLYNLSSVTSVLFTEINKRGRLKIDEILIPFISQAMRFIIIAITFSIVVSVFGYNISGFVAGLGLGGLAFALAAQDALSNLFGGFVILTEKPFTVGDWIETPSVEGTVENITFRSTIIRTFSDSLVTIPNATLSNEPITNWSKMGHRRVYYHLAISYATGVDKLREVVQRIDDLLTNNEDVVQDSFFVTFDAYQENGTAIMLYYFTKSTVWRKHLEVKQEVNFNILEILEEVGVSVAVPTRRMVTTDQEEGQLPIKE